MADKLEIEPGQPGSIHFGAEARGFDQEFFLQLLSERKEIKLSRGVRTTLWKQIRDRNEALDLIVMILCLVDVFRTRIDQASGPQLAAEGSASDRSASEPTPWGARSAVDLYAELDAPIGAKHSEHYQYLQQAGAIRFGAQNRGFEW